jgi:hypothetical protein
MQDAHNDTNAMPRVSRRTAGFNARRLMYAPLLLCCALTCAAQAPVVSGAFRGVWVAATRLCATGASAGCDEQHEAGASLWLYQYGNRICGEWSQGIYGGRVWSGNVIGAVNGDQARVRIGQDLQHSAARPYPLQAASPTLFRLRGGKLMWYADRGATQVRHTMRRARDPLLLAHFNDQEFLRLCRSGVDFQ